MAFWKKISAVILPSVLLSSCSALLMKADVKNTPTNCFDLMWQTVDENYSFFDYKKINWQEVRTRYRKRVTDTMSQDSLFNVLSAMLYELNDGHVNLSTSTDRSRNWSFKDDYPDNYNPNFVFRQYFKRDYKLTGALPNQILPDSIGYVRYGSFSNPISTGDLDYVMERFKDMRGIIIDVRDNGGGAMSTVFKIMARFVDKKTLVGYTCVKNGRRHGDFTKPSPLYASPEKKRTPFLKPVVILINRGCYSATTHFAAFMSLLPNVTLVGDTTGGGGGIPMSADLPNGWQYRFSATYQTLPDGTQIEHGFPPKIFVSTGPEDELKGRDAIVEKGVEVIQEQVKNKKS